MFDEHKGAYLFCQTFVRVQCMLYFVTCVIIAENFCAVKKKVEFSENSDIKFTTKSCSAKIHLLIPNIFFFYSVQRVIFLLLVVQ